MPLSFGQRLDRTRRRTADLAYWINRDRLDLTDWRFDGEPLAVGAAWPNRDGLHRLTHPAVEVPAAWPLEESRLELDLGGESLVELGYGHDGGSGEKDRLALDPNHRRFVLRQRRFSIATESVARLPFGVPNRDARITIARLVRIEPAVEALHRLLTLVEEAVDVLGDHEVVDPLLTAAEQAFYRLHWPSATSTYLSRTAESRHMQRIWEPAPDLDPSPAGLEPVQREAVTVAVEELDRELRRLAELYPPQGALALSGHAHIDLAWLWPMAETRRKAVRTFSTMVSLMEHYPEFRFNQSTAALYDFIEQDDPTLFETIRERVATGQWETIGAMWVEPDTNMPTGEAFARHLLYGQRYFERVFNVRHRVCWLPDCFGFSPALPQLLRLAGVDSFFTIKVNWSETNPMPFDLFWWEGLDGSRVLAHTFNNPAGGYNAALGPLAMLKTWQNYRGKHTHHESLLSYGFGDGGGGPTEDMLERERQLAAFPVLPRMRQTHVADYFGDLHQSAAERALPVWVGEIYLEYHRGTLTTQSGTKYLNRRAERALIAADTVTSLSYLMGGPVPKSLEKTWRVLLHNQFHDILPGSSIREVHAQAEAELTQVVTQAGEALEEGLGEITERMVEPGDRPGLLVVNPDLSARSLALETPFELPGGQAVQGGWVACTERAIAPLSAAVILETSPPAELSVADTHLENAYLRVELDEHGRLARVFDKRLGREVLEEPCNQLWAYLDQPSRYDAWDIENDYEGNGEELLALAERRVIEEGPHRAAVRLVRRYRHSTITQDIRLWANTPRIEFKTSLDWHDRRVLLKARFPLRVRAQFATFECAFGVIRRTTYNNSWWDRAQFEVAAHRFVDLSEPGFGAALLNDGKYGHSAKGNEITISLLRSPTYPDPLADEGAQSFTYALQPHGGDWLAGGVLAAAEELNRPLLSRAVRTREEGTWRGPQVQGLQLGLGGLKLAEDGRGLIMRTYEPAGARGRIAIELPQGWSLGDEVNVLEESSGPAELDIRPFQVSTKRLLPS